MTITKPLIRRLSHQNCGALDFAASVLIVIAPVALAVLVLDMPHSLAFVVIALTAGSIVVRGPFAHVFHKIRYRDLHAGDRVAFFWNPKERYSPGLLEPREGVVVTISPGLLPANYGLAFFGRWSGFIVTVHGEGVTYRVPAEFVSLV